MGQTPAELENDRAGRGARALRAWVGAVQRRAPWVVAAALLATAGLAWYAATHLSVDTDTEHMLSAQLPWRQAQMRLDRLFPRLDTGLVVVIDGENEELAADAQQRLVAALEARPQLFSEVYAAETDPFFRRNGLLYLDTDALQKLADDLNQAQPFLGALAQDPSLHGLFTLLDRAVTTTQSEGFALAPALERVAAGVDAAVADRFYALSWQNLIGSGGAGLEPKRRFIELRPHRDYGRLLPAAAAIDTIRALGRQLHIDAAHGLRLRLTGSAALEHEEIQSAFEGGVIAFSAALAMVAALLFLALRSVRLVVSAVLTLGCGLIATAAFAAAAVGHLNLISIAFGVLYIGLGIDYALYLCMRYRELLGEGTAADIALPRAAGDVGGFMAVCAATTSLGFFAFIPTPFTGIGELGLISGAGMFVSLFVSLTLLPALIHVLPPDPARARLRRGGAGLGWRVLDWPYRHARAIWIVAGLLAVGALFLAPQARFDKDPLDLRDPNSESVSTFRDLLRDPNIPTLAVSVLTDGAAQARELATKLARLPLVAHALTLSDLIPDDQDAKLAILDQLNLTLGPALATGSGPLTIAARADDYAAIDQFAQDLPAYAARRSGADREAARRLQTALQGLAEAWSKGDAAAHDALLARLRQALLGTLPQHIDALREALAAQPVTEKDLPPALVERWKSADGTYRIEVWPKEVLDNTAAMERFVAQVRTVAPDAAGGPVGYIESGQAVVHAFRLAFLYSFVAITLLLIVLLRSFADTLLVLIPLALAILLTLAGMVLLRVPFNFANVIALPLILGVGVDYGVYLVQHGRARKGNLLHTGTARAVLFGALITVANFGNLMLARHPGMASMGLLLTLGLTMTLLCALVLLPSLLARRR
ncbi:MAG: MMPL family transporter [Sinobacteraceae bacterium]|nr:MMPL family transporter [Nevskiaceae bacterium]